MGRSRAPYVKLGVLAMAEYWWFTGIEPQSRRAHGERTDGDDYYQEANMLFISNKDKLRVSVSSVSLWLIIVAV